MAEYLPFIASTRKEILSELLKTEQQVGRILLSDEEMRAIQAEWSREFDVMESAYRIAEKFGREPWKLFEQST